MFYGVLHNPKGLTAKELFYYLERVIAHGDGESIVYASSKPVIMISCEPSCVLMETKENKQNIKKDLNTKMNNCEGCCHDGCCGYFSDLNAYDISIPEEEQKAFEEFCCGCCCGEGAECNRNQGCDNYEIKPTIG